MFSFIGLLFFFLLYFSIIILMLPIDILVRHLLGRSHLCNYNIIIMNSNAKLTLFADFGSQPSRAVYCFLKINKVPFEFKEIQVMKL